MAGVHCYPVANSDGRASTAKNCMVLNRIDSITDSDDESEDMVGDGGGDYFLEEFERSKRQKTKDAWSE